MMRKLLIVPAILAMTSVSGSAYAQRASTGTTTAIGSPVGTIGSPVIGVNVGVIPQVAVLNFGGSGNQNATLQQGNQGGIGIGGNSSAQGGGAPRASTGATTAIGSPVGTIGSPVIGVNVGVIPQVAVLNFGGSGNQNATLQQGNQGAIGIGGNSSAQGVR